MTIIITDDPAALADDGDGEEPTRRPRPVFRLPQLDSAAAVFLLGLVLALAGGLLPTSVRWVTWPLAMFVPGHAIVSATFGRHLDFGGFRRVGLSSALTLVAYPLIALAGVVVGLRLTHGLVVGGTLLLVTGCAAVIARREHRERTVLADDAPEPDLRPANRLRVGELVMPFFAIFLGMFIVWGSVQVLPRKAPDEFSAISLDGTWALTARAVPANPSRDVEVTYRIENSTTDTQVYEVTAGIVDGPGWTGNVHEVAAGESIVGTVSGRALTGSCRARLEVDMNVVDDDEDHFPLAVFLRDSTIDC